MGAETVRSTVYLEADVHRALRLKGAAAHRSMSDIVNDALRAAFREDEEDLAVFTERVSEPSISYDALLAEIKNEPRPRIAAGVSAEELLERFRHLPSVDPEQFRADIDSLFAVPGADRQTDEVDDELLAQAQRLTGLKERSVLIHEGLEALVQRESARRLARLGGSEPAVRPIPRRRSEPS